MIYTDENRGVILNADRMRQLIEFRSLKVGTITPMDVDGLLEYHDKAYIFFEYKLEGATMSAGQRVALERMADDCQKAGKEAVVFLCEHSVHDTRKIVDAGDAIVKRVYYKHRWIAENQRRTVKDRMMNFLEYVDKKGESNDI